MGKTRLRARAGTRQAASQTMRRESFERPSRRSVNTMGISARRPPARKMRQALALLRAQAPELEVDGEMHADAALLEYKRNRLVSDSRLRGAANLLVMPNLDAANISLTLLQASTNALLVWPMLLGMSKPVHVLTPSVTARGIVNLTALAAVEASTGRML